jgi:quercetin dioxygenase-like cupin family protein
MKSVGVDRSQAVPQDSSPSGHFQGEVHMQRLANVPADGEIEFLAVYFSAGARTRPHIHEHDQYLQIVEGRGLVATESEKRSVAAGEIVIVPAGTWHWHGATPHSAMMHLSIRRPGPGKWDVDLKDWATVYGEIKE